MLCQIIRFKICNKFISYKQIRRIAFLGVLCVLATIFNTEINAQSNSIYYFHDKSEVHDSISIQSETFSTYKTTVQQGANNGAFWFKVIIKNQDKKPLFRIIQLDALTTNINAYLNNNPLDVTKNSPCPNIKVMVAPGLSTYFVKVVYNKQADLSIQVLSDHQFSQKENNKVLRIGLYFGIVLMIILINLFYYFTFKDKTFLYYVFMLFSINCCLWFGDTSSYLFSLNDRFIDILELITHLFTPTLTTIFVVTYLNIREDLPQFKWFIIPSILAACLFGIAYISTKNFFYFAISDTFAMIAMSTCWIASVILFNKKTYHKFFSLAYVMLWVFSFDYFVGPKFGVQLLGIDAVKLKVAGVLEMILMTFSVVYRMQVLNKENKDLSIKIEEFMTIINEESKDINEVLLSLGLSSREIEVSMLLYNGKSNEQIANELFISKNTIKFHIKNIYSKLDVKNRTEAKDVLQEAISTN